MLHVQLYVCLLSLCMLCVNNNNIIIIIILHDIVLCIVYSSLCICSSIIGSVWMLNVGYDMFMC